MLTGRRPIVRSLAGRMRLVHRPVVHSLVVRRLVVRRLAAHGLVENTSAVKGFAIVDQDVAVGPAGFGCSMLDLGPGRLSFGHTPSCRILDINTLRGLLCFVRPRYFQNPGA